MCGLVAFLQPNLLDPATFAENKAKEALLSLVDTLTGGGAVTKEINAASVGALLAVRFCSLLALSVFAHLVLSFGSPLANSLLILCSGRLRACSARLPDRPRQRGERHVHQAAARQGHRKFARNPPVACDFGELSLTDCLCFQGSIIGSLKKIVGEKSVHTTGMEMSKHGRDQSFHERHPVRSDH